jgi:hypothetical protein
VQCELGPRAGRPLRKLVLPEVGLDPDSRTHERQAAGGFDLDIGPLVRPWERQRLERLCRYLLRPPLALERLEQLPDGRLKYGLRHPWRDGTTAVILEPLDLIARLAALVPAPRRHQLRYHGTLAPHSAWRQQVVPAPPATEDAAAGGSTEGSEAGGERRRSSRIPWAELLRRVFAIDVLECCRCGGRMSIIATVTESEAVRKILTCIGLPARPPPVAAARGERQGELDFEG